MIGTYKTQDNTVYFDPDPTGRIVGGNCLRCRTVIV